jgi:glycosyltransferase involved in cell wall biosynthesis
MSSDNQIICVIPTLNAEATLPATLESLGSVRSIVVDGGSVDGTKALALAAEVKFVTAPRGRGQQLGAGAEVALADGARWLLFLHADTVLEDGWLKEAEAFVSDPAQANNAAVFAFKVDDDRTAARRLERLVAWRTGALALPYGDQGLLISGGFYQSLGGYRPLELMEDVDLMRRIGGKRLHVFKATAMTSAHKFRQAGYLRRSLRNLSCLGLFFLGLPVRWIARIYG